MTSRSVGQALEEEQARSLAHGLDAETTNLQDWFISQLYQVDDDPVLVPIMNKEQLTNNNEQPRPTDHAGEPANLLDNPQLAEHVLALAQGAYNTRAGALSQIGIFLSCQKHISRHRQLTSPRHPRLPTVPVGLNIAIIG